MDQSRMADIETKGQPVRALEMKHEDAPGSFAGYASIFRIADRQGDVIEPGAFFKAIRERAGEIRLLWQHDPAEPIGVFKTIREDAVGLYVEGQILLDVQRGREAHALLKSGALDGLSIGYTPVRFRHDTDNGHRIIEELELWEISLVTFPANPQAGVRRVKGRREAGGAYDKNKAAEARAWEAALRSGAALRLMDEVERARQVLLDCKRHHA